MHHRKRIISTATALLGMCLVYSGTVPAAGANGEAVYNQTCIACHGADGKGALPGTPDFTAADGPLGKSDEVLLDHIINGFQSPGSFMAMPPRGGNASLSDEELGAVLRYLREGFGG